MNRHLLSLAALHAEDPGAIDVVFGPDGDFEGAPYFSGPILARIRGEIPISYHHVCTSYEPDQIGVMRNDGTRKLCDAPALDLRIPSVAARLAGLCARAGHPDLGFQDNEVIAQARYGGPSWNEAWAVRLAALTLTLAPRIAALRSTT